MNLLDMKLWKLTAVGAIALMGVVGCSNDHLIRTEDGQLIESDEKPEIDDDTGMIEYEDEQGYENQMKQSEVKEIIER
ncbi:MAG: YgdI/YgdR family lipoprotein [Halopseudomonas sp.]|uniref:YgdI/YgdR family lipoprotein n=1 Tax=Halopseudomonas sp. TaxID=2901191 RepID=UPI0030021EAE